MIFLISVEALIIPVITGQGPGQGLGQGLGHSTGQAEAKKAICIQAADLSVTGVFWDRTETHESLRSTPSSLRTSWAQREGLKNLHDSYFAKHLTFSIRSVPVPVPKESTWALVVWEKAQCLKLDQYQIQFEQIANFQAKMN